MLLIVIAGLALGVALLAGAGYVGASCMAFGEADRVGRHRANIAPTG